MNSPAYYYPQKMGGIILLGLEEIIGKAGLDTVLRLGTLEEAANPARLTSDKRTFSFQSVSGLHLALEQAYGPRGGRGLALRAGRACFKYGLREYGSLLGLTEMAFRMLPLQTKLRIGSRSFADLFNRHSDQKVRIDETETSIVWIIERCPLCWERAAEEPSCQLAVGLLQEALYWLSGGRIFEVEETACHARGDAYCTISVSKMPLD